jgi:hypothetical protein
MAYIADSITLKPKAAKVKMYMYVVATRFYIYNSSTDTDDLSFYTDWQVAMNEVEARYEHMQNFTSLYNGPDISVVNTISGLVPFDDVAKVFISHQ